MKYRIVSDSGSNIYNEEGVDFASVPLRILFNGTEYEDAPGLDAAELIRTLHEEKGTSGTSCPNIHDYLCAYEGADRIFVITISSGMSGSYHHAVAAALEYMENNPGTKVHVIDSLSTGPEMQLIIEHLRAGILAGDSFEKICLQTAFYKQRTRLLYGISSLHNLHKAGRVSAAVAKITEVIGIRVLGAASEIGTVQIIGKFRTERKMLSGIFEEMKSRGYSGGQVRISHCINEKGAAMLQRLITQDFPSAVVRILPCAGLCSYYADRGGLIVGFEV